MVKYIDAEKLIAEIEKRQEYLGDHNFHSMASEYDWLLTIVQSLQQEQPMPDSTKLIELWHADKEMLKEKDFRNDPWRLAYNAFMCGFGRGLAVNKQEQPEVDLEKEITDKSRACCNCVNGISQYHNCYCWQHEYCNTDEPYKIPKEDWVDTAKTCKKFELELGLNARK